MTQKTTSNRAFQLSLSGQRAPVDYERAPSYSGMIAEKDVLVPMRDGVKIAVDIYRPDTTDKLPALLALSIHNKDLQGPELAEASLSHPAWSMLWTGPAEAGDTRFFVARGYVHVIGNPRGIGKSEGGGSRAFDSYDFIEWIAAQPWCDGNVGMIGISGFGAEQLMAAKLNPPHLKAIFPFDPRGAYGEAGGFRDEYPGGVIHLFRFLLQAYASAHQQKGQPKPLPAEREKLWQEAIANPDFKMYPHVYNVLALKGQHFPAYFDVLVDPYDKEAAVEKSEAEFSRITVPTYTGSGWYGYTYKTHLIGAQNWFRNIAAPKKLLLAGPAHLDRPVTAFRSEMLRWHDQWLKGIDTGILDEPPVRFWVMGANEWRSGSDWPLPETQWIKFYLRGWERLTTEPFAPSSADDYQAPDAFVQMPASQTNRIQKLRYLSEPLAEDLTVAGPSVLNLYAAIDQDDTNWIVVLKDLGPDVGVQTAREGERDVTGGLHERELTRGWLKASHWAVDEKRSLPGRPWHPLTRAARKPVVPGEINEYAIEIMATANRFKKDHRICVEIMSLDVATGVGGATNVEYIPYHICSSKTVLHRIYHDPRHPSHLLLPVIPTRERLRRANAPGAIMPEITIHNPDVLGKPLGQYSQITRVKASEFLFIAGQVATDRDGKLVGEGDFDAQCRQVFANIEAALKSQGGDFANVVEFTTYLVHSEDIAKFMQFRLREFPRMFPSGRYPPNTLLIVDRLVQEPLLIEVTTVAAL